MRGYMDCGNSGWLAQAQLTGCSGVEAPVLLNLLEPLHPLGVLLLHLLQDVHLRIITCLK